VQPVFFTGVRKDKHLDTVECWGLTYRGGGGGKTLEGNTGKTGGLLDEELAPRREEVLVERDASRAAG